MSNQWIWSSLHVVIAFSIVGFVASKEAFLDDLPAAESDQLAIERLKGDVEDLDVAEQNYGGGRPPYQQYGNNDGGAHVSFNGPLGVYVAAGIGGNKNKGNGGGANGNGGGIFGNGGGIFGNNGGGIFGNNGGGIFNNQGGYGVGYGNGGGGYYGNGGGRPGFLNRFFGR